MSLHGNGQDTAMRSLEKRYSVLRDIFDNSDPEFVMEQDGTMLEVNETFAAIIGRTVQECLMINAFDMLEPEVSAIRKSMVDEALKTGKSITFEDERQGLFIRTTLRPLADSEGKFTRISISRQDITAVRRAELESKTQKIFSSALIEAMPGGFYVLDADGRFVQWNAYERDMVMGKKESEMSNTLAIESIHPDYRPFILEKINQIMTSGIEDSAEVKVLIHGGPLYRWHQLSAKRIFIDNRPFLIGTATDVTARKYSDMAALKKSEERFNIMFKEHSAIKLLIDPETSEIVDANEAAAEFYMWPIQELRTMTMEQINTLPPDEVKGALENNRLEGGNRPLLFQHRRADGSLRHVEVFSKTINLGGRSLLYAIIHDITERIQAERQLTIMSTTVEQSPTAVIITNPVGAIEYVNPMFTKLTGYTAEEAKKQNPRILQSGLMPEGVYQELWETILAGKVWRGEIYNKKKNGKLYWESEVISAIRNSEGEIINFVAVKVDITEQKHMLEALIAAKDKAIENDRLKSAFLANISHEIRTPMNGILGFSELLQETYHTDEERAEYLGLIHQSGHRMLNLINDLVDISRIEAGETRLHLSPTPINEVVGDLCAFFKPQADNKGLRLRSTTGLPDNESIIVTDNAKVQQILTNLVQNAMTFTRSGGIEVGYTKKENMLEFYVADSGIGIPVSMHKSIFDRFQQVDKSLTRAHEGSGLGLCISEAFVNMLGGSIRVESAEGKGSTFIFTLPYTLEGSLKPEQLSPDLPEQTTAPPPLMVLIAEDDEVSTMLLTKSLKNENINFLCAENGWVATELVERHPEINLVIMDLKMPVMNGFEATKLIKLDHPDLPIVVLSAFTSEEVRQKAKEAGCDGFITKPIGKEELVEITEFLVKR